MSENTYPAHVDASSLTGDDKDTADLTVDQVAGLPWDGGQANNDRALSALAAVTTYATDRENLHESVGTLLGDLLGDLRHLADAVGVDFAKAVDGTYDCYSQELYDQDEARLV